MERNASALVCARTGVWTGTSIEAAWPLSERGGAPVAASVGEGAGVGGISVGAAVGSAVGTAVGSGSSPPGATRVYQKVCSGPLIVITMSGVP